MWYHTIMVFPSVASKMPNNETKLKLLRNRVWFGFRCLRNLLDEKLNLLLECLFSA